MITSLGSLLWLKEFLERINLVLILRILFILIIITGIIGNVINIMVFSKKKMRKLATFRFLLYLSIIDLIILVMCGVETFFSVAFNIDLRVFHMLFCRCNTFLAYFLLQTRNVLSMAITILSIYVIFIFKFILK